MFGGDSYLDMCSAVSYRFMMTITRGVVLGLAVLRTQDFIIFGYLEAYCVCSEELALTLHDTHWFVGFPCLDFPFLTFC